MRDQQHRRESNTHFNYTYGIQFSRTWHWLGKRRLEKVRVDRRKFNVVVIASESYAVKSTTDKREHANYPLLNSDY